MYFPKESIYSDTLDLTDGVIKNSLDGYFAFPLTIVEMKILSFLLSNAITVKLKLVAKK